jgi:S-adenosylmethionine synthetase
MIRTAECVTPKHPDKMCDRIADAILTEAIKQDPNARTAIEVCASHGIVTVMGEMTTKAFVDVADIARRITDGACGVQVNIVRQSPDIAMGVDAGGAGDQGIMIGYACNENDNLIPMELNLARDLCQFIYMRHEVDGKTQITMDGNKISTIVASFHNTKSGDLRSLVHQWLDGRKCESIMCNPAGDWKIGGLNADSGVTGRKLAIDNYGPGIPIGGGAYSGKDPTKVDRSAAYMARKIARDILIAENAHNVYVYLAYAIGIAQPTMATSFVDGKERPVSGYDLTPMGIIEYLGLRSPIYERTAEWGHYGHSGFAWER